MADIRDKSTVDAVAREFVANGRNKTQAMIAVGYDPAYSDSGKGHKLIYGNKRVIDAIAKIDAKHEKKLEHNRTIAIALLHKNIEYLTPAAESGDTRAISALTAVIRELSAISSLHSATTNVNNITKDVPQSSQEIEAGEEAAKVFKLKLANG